MIKSTVRRLRATFACLLACLVFAACPAGELLYNGIQLPEVWPPKYEQPTREPMRVPYLEQPPELIPIDVGRQLFVDDFLIDDTDLQRVFHRPNYHPANPVLAADKAWELETDVPGAGPFSDGVYFDPNDRLFKIWYVAPMFRDTCYAASRDGIHWEKPALSVVPDTNIVHPAPPAVRGRYRDSCSICLDHRAANPARRFLMFQMVSIPTSWSLTLRSSPDGQRWSEPVATSRDTLGDRTTAFFNPFRNKWVVSVRIGYDNVGRARAYLEGDDPAALVSGAPQGAVPWTCADRLDPHHPNPEFRDIEPQLYNLDAAPYESLMLGQFSIWQGPPNGVCAERGIHKRNELLIGFSRDGFHWQRPDRERFLGVNEVEGAWNWGNVQSVGGGCLVVGDQLFFYVSGRGLSDKFWDANHSTGLATLRRDGFASMDAGDKPGMLSTRPIRFSGAHLFVNVATAQGELLCEVLDADGQVIEPFNAKNCLPLAVDSTMAEVRWQGADDLSAVANRNVRFRFRLRSGALYAFWVSPDASGASGGYVAGGGPGFTGPRDTVDAR